MANPEHLVILKQGEVDFKVNLKSRQVVLSPRIADEFNKRARAKKVRLDKLVNRVLADYLRRAV